MSADTSIEIAAVPEWINTKSTMMKTKTKALEAILGLTQWKWTRLALLTAALLSALFGLTGCPGHHH